MGSVVNGGVNAVLAGGATATNSIGTPNAYAKSFTGSWANLGTGTVLFSKLGPTLGRRVFVFFWSETGGGTFTVESDFNGDSNWTTLKAGTLTGGGLNGQVVSVSGNATINASGVVDASEGGATGALRCLIFDFANPEYLRIRCNGSGSTGSAKIISAGAVEVVASGTRLSGYVGLDCSMAGSTPQQWDDMPDQAIQTVMNFWNPDVIYVRGSETLTDWQNSFAPLAAKFLAIKPNLEFVLVGMHVTGSNNTNTLDSIDQWQQQWCDQNNGVFIPVRNRMGTIDWSIENRLTGTVFGGAFTVTSGSASTNILTLSNTLPANTNGSWIILESKSGGSNLVVGRAYRILSGQGTNQMMLADYNGTTPISLGSDVTEATIGIQDALHMSSEGQSFVAGIVIEAMNQFFVSRFSLNGYAPTNEGWQRNVVTPERIQSDSSDRAWTFAGPSYKRRSISIGNTNGNTAFGGYPSAMSIGSFGSNSGYITGPNSSGVGFLFDANFGVFGQNVASGTFRSLNAGVNGLTDWFEVFGNSNANNRNALAVSTIGNTAAHGPLQVWRNNASSSSKGTEVARMDALGRFSPTIPEYANDAAADADSALPSGFLYRVTGNRAVFRKP
jgi:hypothetical protein